MQNSFQKAEPKIQDLAKFISPDVRDEWLSLRSEIDHLNKEMFSINDIDADTVRKYISRIKELEAQSAELSGLKRSQQSKASRRFKVKILL